MMSDDDTLAALLADWRQQPVDFERAQLMVQKRERRLALWTGLNRAAMAIAPLIGGWFAYWAWARDEAIFAVAAVAMLLLFPLMLFERWSIGPKPGAAPRHTPVEILVAAHRQAKTSLKLLRTIRWSGIILLACALLAGVLYSLGQLALENAIFLASVWMLTGLLALAWQRARRRRLLAEIEGCERHLLTFDQADLDEE